MACTVAVEEVIDEYYAEQAAELEDDPKSRASARPSSASPRARHRDIVGHEAELTPGYEILSGLIKAGSRAAIWLSKRI